LSVLNLSSNSLAELTFVDDGWGDKVYDAQQQTYLYKHTDGREQTEKPAQEPKGAVALAAAIQTDTTVSSLNLSGNSLGAEGAKSIAGALKVRMVLVCQWVFNYSTEPLSLLRYCCYA
jgi:hypothetical protein